jgi:hypothetical protein
MTRCRRAFFGGPGTAEAGTRRQAESLAAEGPSMGHDIQVQETSTGAAFLEIHHRAFEDRGLGGKEKMILGAGGGDARKHVSERKIFVC